MKMTQWIVSASLVGVALIGAACEPQQPLDQPPPGDMPPTQPDDPMPPPEDPATPPDN